MTLCHEDRMLILAALQFYGDQFRADASREYGYADNEPKAYVAHRAQAEILLGNAVKCITLRNRIIQERE
jgi:hypothetical protein